jgi:DNA-binding CsgD family transcriptional regulator
MAVSAPQPIDPLARLNARQREVLHLVCKGLRNSEIAAQIGISPRTAKRLRINK